MYTIAQAPTRRLILIDIENLVGGGITMASQVHAAQAAIGAAIGTREGDQIVLACGQSSASLVGFEWEGPRRFRFRRGIDGADLELLDVLESEQVGERFTEVLLASGDGIFTDAVSWLAYTSGTEVTVVSRPEACSRSLRMAAKNIIYLDFEQNTLMEAA